MTPEQVMAQSLRALRESRQFSQERVAELMREAGYSWQQTTVAKTEAGARPIRVNEAVELARIFKAAVDIFLDPVGDEFGRTGIQIRLAEARANLDAAQHQVETAQAALERAKNDKAEAEKQLRLAKARLVELEHEDLRASELNSFNPRIRFRKGGAHHRKTGPEAPADGA